MSKWGLCVNARGAWPSQDELRTLGARWVRSIVYDFDEFGAALAQYDENVKVIALVNQETQAVGGDPLAWADVAHEALDRFGTRLAAVECLNEWDLQGIAPEDAAGLAGAVARYAFAIKAPCKVLLGSVAGPQWPERLRAALDAAIAGGDWFDGVCFHPYAQRAGGVPKDWGVGELYTACAEAAQLARLPVYVTEYGLRLEDVDGDEGTQAEYSKRARGLLEALGPVAAACQFCWSDAMAPDGQFGLRDADLAPRLAWTAMAEMGARDG
jgi:hypothetical protein